jgi:catechol 2,3-dioxygenase-like lactoylglutathione lyase family enzyme
LDWTLEVVQVSVADVDRAKAFYADGLGFAVDLDMSPAPGTRVTQLTAPGSGCSIQVCARLRDDHARRPRRERLGVQQISPEARRR